MLRAKFVRATHLLTVTSGEGGSATGGGTYEHGKTANIEAIADPGYEFVEWEALRLVSPLPHKHLFM